MTRPKRRFWRIHLSTALVLMVESAVILFLFLRAMGYVDLPAFGANGESNGASVNEPVAVVHPQHVDLKPSARGSPSNYSDLVILDGSDSRANSANASTTLTYQWRQIRGDDLNLDETRLAKTRVGLRIYQPGDYAFELVVTANGVKSKPAVMTVSVTGNPWDRMRRIGATYSGIAALVLFLTAVALEWRIQRSEERWDHWEEIVRSNESVQSE